MTDRGSETARLTCASSFQLLGPPRFWMLTQLSGPPAFLPPHAALLPAQHFLELCGCWAQTHGCLSICGRLRMHPHECEVLASAEQRKGTSVPYVETYPTTQGLTLPPGPLPLPQATVSPDTSAMTSPVNGKEEGSGNTASSATQRWRTPQHGNLGA